MKKICILLTLTVLLLAGCSGSNVAGIEEHTWVMTTVQSTEADGQAIAYGTTGQSTLDDAVMIELECKAVDGNLTLSDRTNNQTYTGTYEQISTDPDASNYKITIGQTEGLAVAAMTTYRDESQKPTLIITLDDYTLNFFPATE